MPRKRKEYPDQAVLKRTVSYDPESGLFISNVAPYQQVGYTVPKLGYVTIRMQGDSYYAHRLAFLYMTGEIPDYVDHVDQIT